MGVVLAAQHLALGERVAIKILSGTATVNRDALARLEREARILARIRNEHVVRVIDLGQLDSGTPFIVMEYLPGCDLDSVLEQRGRLRPELAVGFILQASVALAAAHSNGVVHRDLKPGNLFFIEQEDGESLIKVLDFGVSRLERAAEQDWVRTSVTDTNTVIGTPLYMSPEQLRNAKGVDARSDLWSLGVVLYELLSGVPPFSGVSFADVAIKIATEHPRPLESLEPSIDAKLGAVVQRCLAKERDERYANVAELARALLPFGPPGSERMVERVERLSRRPSVELPKGDELSFSASFGPLQPAGSSPPSSAVEAAGAARARSMAWLRRAWTLAALAVVLLLVAWRFVAASSPNHEERAASPVTSAEVHRTMEERPGVSQPVAPVVEVIPISSSAPSPDSAGPVADAPPGAAKSETREPATRSFMKALCNPPYTVDAQGRKKFRHECFIGRPVQ
jgi:serine/threonine-protein kinase